LCGIIGNKVLRKQVVPRGTKKTERKLKAAEETLLAGGDEQSRDYEMVLVINPEAAGEKFDAILSNVNQLITSLGGTVSDVEQWGKRKLAYPIKSLSEGNYVLTHFRLKPSLSRELEAKLRISEEIPRHLLISLSS
jgi:small subunit ribosomal protein S6